MRYLASVCFVFAFALLAGIQVRAQESDLKVVDEVVAQVNDGVITLSRVKREIDTVVDSMVTQGKTKEAARAETEAKRGDLIANIINEELVLQKGKELGVDSDVEAQINQRFLEFMKQQNLKTLEALYKEMEKQGVDPQGLRDDLRRQFTKDLVMQREVDGKTYWGWTPREIKAYYEKNKEKFTKPEMVTLSEIFLSFAGRDEAAVREKARQLVAQLRGGADFGKLAVENSDRPDAKETKGSVGEVSIPQLRELNAKLIAPISATKVGAISDPVEVVEGIEIFRVDARKDASKDSFFDEAEVRKAMTFEVLPERRKQYLISLREQAYIKISDTYRPMVSPILFADERTTAEKKPTN